MAALDKSPSINFTDKNTTIYKISINHKNPDEIITILDGEIHGKKYSINGKIYQICESYIKDPSNHSFIHFKKEEISFTIRKIYYVNDRTHVVLYSCKSNENAKRIELYTSKSNLGFFRLCILDPVGEKYEKGYNYISTTFINLSLQKFIYDNIHHYGLLSRTHTIKCVEISDMDRESRLRINGDANTFISQDPLFLMFNDFFPLVNAVLDPDHFSQTLDEYKVKKKDIIKNEIFIKLLKDYKRLLIEYQTISSSKTAYLHLLGIFLEKQFTDVFGMTKSMELFKFDSIFNDVIIPITVLFKLVGNKTTKRLYKLYYIKYNYDGKEYNNIIHIIPNDNEITKYGLDKRYVVCGLFINKPFDYQIQVMKTVVPGSGLKAKVDKHTDYTFIGDYMNYKFLK